MKNPTIASISIPFSSALAYFFYVGLGLFVGILLLLITRDWADGQITFVAGNLLLYAGAIFAHFRFAHGISSWPTLEQNDLGKAIAWGLFLAFAGYVAISFINGIWLRNLQGFDDGWRLHPETQIREAARHFGRITAIVITIINAVVVAPIAEEIIFRSGVYRILKGKVSGVAAAGISAVLFAIGHGSVTAFVPLVVLGYLCCWVYERTVDIRGPIILHAGYNFLVFFTAIPNHV